MNKTGDFNPSPPTVMHIDLNSCFASVEQQANPLLRGKPVVVAAYTTPRGCILAASRQAKVLGVKTGMRVGEGRTLCPGLVVLPSDPSKYRWINTELTRLLHSFSPHVLVKSIDEMVIDMKDNCSIVKLSNCRNSQIANHQSLRNKVRAGMKDIALEIKQRIRQEIGEYLTVSIGISTNRYLSKVASDLHKPDGLDVIDADNIIDILGSLSLEELHGIKNGFGGRLRQAGIHTPVAFYHASESSLRHAFASIIGHYWWLRLHGWDEPLYGQKPKTVGHSYALHTPHVPCDPAYRQIVCTLVMKMGRRLRHMGMRAGGVHLGLLFTDYSFWGRGRKERFSIYKDTDLWHAACRLSVQAPVRPVRTVSVSCFALSHDLYRQQTLLEDERRGEGLTRAVDRLGDRWGDRTVFPGQLLGMKSEILDRISFGSVPDSPVI